MSKKMVNRPFQIDLSNKRPEEITEYIEGLMAIRYLLNQKGINHTFRRKHKGKKQKVTI